MFGLRLTAASLFALLSVGELQAQDCGLWNVPGTTGQFFGHGFGAGHHAPMVRAPSRKPPYVPRVALDRSYSRQRYSACTYAPQPVYHAGCYQGGGHCATCSGQPMAPPVQHLPMMRSTTDEIFFAPQKSLPAMPKLKSPSPATPQPSSEEVMPAPAMPKVDSTARRGRHPNW